jgi:hypothetical protein
MGLEEEGFHPGAKDGRNARFEPGAQSNDEQKNEDNVSGTGEGELLGEQEENGTEGIGEDPGSEETELYLQKYFRDHFTLPAPSTTVRFRSANTAARVFENKGTQFILEETYDPINDVRKIQVKRLKNGTKGLQFLRGTYTLVSILWGGILIVFCIQVLLTLVLDLAIETGKTSLKENANWWKVIG